MILYRHDVLSAAVCKLAYKPLRKAARSTDNRGMAAGSIEDIAVGSTDKERLKDGRIIGERTAMRYRPMKQDGTISNTNYAASVESGIIGLIGVTWDTDSRRKGWSISS